MGKQIEQANAIQAQVASPQMQQQVGTSNNGLAGMFANPTGQGTNNMFNLQQYGLAGTLGNYRNMWQPNKLGNYQISGGVGNII